MAINLTEGAIAMLSNGEAQNNDLKPVLQVCDVKQVNTKTPTNSVERYRLLLSDGIHLQQGMLGTQLNDLVRSQKLQNGSIIQLNQFVCNLIQNRMIIIIVDLNLILENCDPIGKPSQFPVKTDSDPLIARSSTHVQSTFNQPAVVAGNTQSFGGGPATSNPYSFGSNSAAGVSPAKPNLAGMGQIPEVDRNAVSNSYGRTFSSSFDSGRYNSTNASPTYAKTEPAGGMTRNTMNSYVRPHPPAYQQPPPMYINRGPVAKNETAPRIIPIAALNPYQGRWTIKARVTAKGELRHYNNARGDGKVFSFDLLDSDGGEIRVTCFNAVADQFYDKIEVRKVYMFSGGSLRPAQKAFNHLQNDHEIFLESTSTVQPCPENDRSIPQQQFHFRPIGDIESMENNSVVDLIGVVSSISPSSSIMRKNGTETQKRVLQLKDLSGRSVELTFWGNFCNAEGQTLQNLCDSGVFPILAVKSGRVNDFNGKSVGTLFTSQLFIDPDFPEAHRLKSWFDTEGKNTPSISISRETISIVRTDERKTVSQIKDERLGTSEKPDWITVSATISFIKMDNFCYSACPIMIGDRQCNKKVTNNGDGKWRCDRCDESVDECDYRYILQFQIQDHTGLTWVTAFQECGEEIIGMSAKELYYLKYEEQDDERLAEIVRRVLFTKYIFKLKVKEEMFSDEQRVKSTAIKAEKVNFSTETKFLLGLMNKLKNVPLGSASAKVDNVTSSTGLNNTSFGNVGYGETSSPFPNYAGNTTPGVRETRLSANQVGQYGNQYTGYRPVSTIATGMSCSSCGGAGHNSMNCPSVMNAQGQSYGGASFSNKLPSATSSGASASSECYKCHQLGHWARDCPGLSNVNATPGRYGSVPRQHIGGF